MSGHITDELFTQAVKELMAAKRRFGEAAIEGDCRAIMQDIILFLKRDPAEVRNEVRDGNWIWKREFVEYWDTMWRLYYEGIVTDRFISKETARKIVECIHPRNPTT